MEHLKNFLDGARRVLMLCPGDDYVRPEGGFARDARVLRGDAAKIGRGLKKTVTRKMVEMQISDKQTRLRG